MIRITLTILAMLLAFLFAITVLMFVAACVGGHGVGDDISPMSRWLGQVVEGSSSPHRQAPAR